VIENFEGKVPQIHPEAFVHPHAVVIGDVTIGARSTIWPGVVLRADMGRIEIGEDTSIQDGTIVHLTEGISDTVVGSRVTVGHGVILHGCRVDDECLIGMGSILLDNCHVGSGSLVAAGSLVTYGTQIESGHLAMGSPAAVRRAVNDRDRAMIENGWKTYVDYGRRYRAGAKS
jgi:carbonic anhydrase/acetyltransferase-like protein (isoleucine patch superfamily)